MTIEVKTIASQNDLFSRVLPQIYTLLNRMLTSQMRMCGSLPYFTVPISLDTPWCTYVVCQMHDKNLQVV